VASRSTGTQSSPGSQSGITVNPAAASSLVVSGFASPSTAGTAGNVTVTAKDAYGNTATGYLGTVSFGSSDSQAALPANYAFVAADAGVHSFSATLKTAGSRSLTATKRSMREGGVVIEQREVINQRGEVVHKGKFTFLVAKRPV